MKRMIALVLDAVVILTCTACGSSSSSGFQPNNTYTPTAPKSQEHVYEAYNGGYKLVACGTNYKSDASVVIPEQYEGANVVAIGNSAFSGFTALETVEIPNTVTEIDKRTFENCTSLNNVIIPDSVTVIRGAAFMNCTALKAIAIPEGVTRIAGHAFHGCASLAQVYVPDSVNEIGSSAFRGCSSLKSIELPKGASVDERAFKDSPTDITYK